jgi:multicomponent Na+:H+ antiporter subunit A
MGPVDAAAKDRALGWGAAAAILVAALALCGLIAGGVVGDVGIDVPWAPTWGLRLSFQLDGLALLYALLAAGVGVLVFAYASAYVPRHLAHHGRPRAEENRLHAAMVLFLVSMVGLAMAKDLIALYVFWDLTAVASWLLIGFDRANRDARLSALMALLVTTVSAVLMLIGILMLRVEYGTVQLDELFAAARQSTTVTVAVSLIAVAALAKSAQVPFHFWLPRAMAAPTPVSAYLHSAAMVAAGVFLLSRLHPLLALDGAVLDGLLVVGLASMAVGGVLALWADGLKRILAYSTISQYGYVVALLGIGGTGGVGAACFYVLAHALAKSALFMTAGAVGEATGANALSQTGGLARRMPLLAAGSAAATAGVAALPLTTGFFKDELFFAAARGHSTALGVVAVAAAALTFAYMWRFWGGLFLGRQPAATEPLERRLVWPVAILGALVVAGGVVVGPFAGLASDAATVSAATHVDLHPAYHLDARAENLMALGAYAGGAVLLAALGALRVPLRLFARAGQIAGPEHVYGVSLRGINRLSDRLHDIEVRDLRGRVVAVVIPGSVLVALGVLLTPFDGVYRPGPLTDADIPLAVTLAVCAVAAVATTVPRRHLALAMSVSGVGFALATAYSLIGAPDVALVAVLIETIFMLLFVGVYALLPRDVLRREAAVRSTRSRRVRDRTIAIVSGVVMALVVWAGLSREIPSDGMARRHMELAAQAHGKDVVTVILADFRGLDTMVEITVVAVAMLAVVLLLRGRLRA